jgi:hypothetical protein
MMFRLIRKVGVDDDSLDIGVEDKVTDTLIVFPRLDLGDTGYGPLTKQGPFNLRCVGGNRVIPSDDRAMQLRYERPHLLDENLAHLAA